MKPSPCTDEERATHALSIIRNAGRSRFAQFLHDYIVAAAIRGITLVPSWKTHWGVSAKTVYQWANPLKVTSAIAAGDLDSLPAEDLLPLLEAWTEEVRARLAPIAPADDPRLIALRASTRAGTLADSATRHMADNVCTASEWADVEGQCAEGEAEFRVAKLAARAARKAALR
jgi:hypothetical protein